MDLKNLVRIMGKNDRKRKKNVNTSEDPSDTNTSHGDTSLLSGVLSGVNRVLYGALGGSPTSESDNLNDGPKTSTPRMERTVTPTNADISAQLIETNKKLDTVLEKLSKLDMLEKRISDMEANVGSMDTRMKTVETKSTELEQAVTFMSAKVDEFQASHSATEAKQVDTTGINAAMLKMKEHNQQLQDTIIDLQCRSMKNNLVFTGLGGDNRDENTEDKLRRFIYNELHIERRIDFGNVHRFGRRVGNRPRPIVARFIYHNDRALVKSSAHLLKGKPFGISEQFPAVIEDRRKELYPVVKELKQQGERVKLVRDRLFVNGQLYTGNVDSASENTSVKKPYPPGPSQNYHTSGAHTSGAHSVSGAAASGPKDSKAKSYAAAA